MPLNLVDWIVEMATRQTYNELRNRQLTHNRSHGVVADRHA